jgi:hypothetical protein
MNRTVKVFKLFWTYKADNYEHERAQPTFFYDDFEVSSEGDEKIFRPERREDNDLNKQV